jgi:hypothetical protein
MEIPAFLYRNNGRTQKQVLRILLFPQVETIEPVIFCM